MNSTNLGPLLANDPLLQLLIQRLQLTPLEFAILGLVSLPLVLFLWCHLAARSGFTHTKATLEGVP